MTDANRIGVVAQSAPSPTGTPVLPTALSPVLSALAAVATAVVSLTPDYTWAHRIALGVLGLATTFGMGTVGWRRKDGGVS